MYVRLQHGQSAHEGRAELFALGRWGTICDDDWSDNDAAVICHMLGYPRLVNGCFIGSDLKKAYHITAG